MKIKEMAAGLALAATMALPATAALPPSISGAWYNPAQSGHGLSLQLLADQRAIAFWYVFDTEGNPVHLYVEGEVQGSTLTGTAYHGEGMRFGSFDPADHRLTHWGTVTLEITGCHTATWSWTADGPAGAGYGDGSTPMVQLAAPARTPCVMNAPGALPPGTWIGGYSRGDSGDLEWRLHAAVDRDGRLWATDEMTPVHPFVGLVPWVITGQATDASAAGLEVRSNLAFTLFGESLVTLEAARDGDGTVLRLAGSEGNAPRRLVLEHVIDAPDPLKRALDPAALAGRQFEVPMRQQFTEEPGQLRFLDDNAFCIDTVNEDCELAGTWSADDPGLAMFSFEALEHAGATPRRSFSGKGWLRAGSDGHVEKVVMVGLGQDGAEQAAFGIVGRARPFGW